LAATLTIGVVALALYKSSLCSVYISDGKLVHTSLIHFENRANVINAYRLTVFF
jgi:hypothetical protein